MTKVELSKLNIKVISIIKSVFAILIGFLFFIPFQNCASNDLEFSQLEIPTEYAYVYGDNEADQFLLSQKIAGYSKPSLNQIFNQWSRISGDQTYQTASEIQLEQNYLFCRTNLDANGNWTPAIDPETGRQINNPGTYHKCLNSMALGALSWSYLANLDTLKCALNANYFVGFVSGVPFDNYENSAVVSSENNDDDTIGLIIASVTDSENNVHVLAAVRTHSDNEPDLGWGMVYYLNGTIYKVFHNLSVGGVFRTTKDSYISPLPSSEQGWSGRKTLIKVIRDKDRVTAFTSEWSRNESDLILSDYSKIELDLSDETLDLSIFRGPQKYGYGTRSQFGASFKSIDFKSSANIKYLYDLKRNLIYKLSENGTYLAVSGSVYKTLGRYVRVINPETQKAYLLNNNETFEEITIR